jgi:hypothetical protein
LAGEEKTLLTFDEKIYDVGAFGWSPNLDKLIFNTLEIPDTDQLYHEKIFDFILLDLENLQSEAVFQGFNQWLRFSSWNEQGQVFYTDWQNKVWRLDLGSHFLSADGTATPNP